MGWTRPTFPREDYLAWTGPVTRLVVARSSSTTRRKIFEYIINTLGSLESMDGRIKQLMGEMLKKNLANVGSATDSLRKRLRRK